MQMEDSCSWYSSEPPVCAQHSFCDSEWKRPAWKANNHQSLCSGRKTNIHTHNVRLVNLTIQLSVCAQRFSFFSYLLGDDRRCRLIITGIPPILTHNHLTLYCLTLLLDPQLFKLLCMICCFPIYYFRSCIYQNKIVFS